MPVKEGWEGIVVGVFLHAVTTMIAKLRLSSFPSVAADRPRGMKHAGFGAYGHEGTMRAGVGIEVGFGLVLRARSVVGPGALRAPRIVALGREIQEHD
jgi:hypothetical protein